MTSNYNYLTSGTDAGYVHVFPRNDENALINAIATIGPIAAAIDSVIIFSFHKLFIKIL